MAHRPKLVLPRTPSERVLQVFATGCVAALLIFTVSVWSQLPTVVPTHFGFAGPPDAWGSRNTLLLLPGVAVLLYLGLSLVERIPHTYNYPIAVTEKNAPELYVFGRQIVLALKVVTIGSLGFVFHTSVRVALGEVTGLSAWFLPVLLGSVVAILVVMVVRMIRVRG